MKSDANVRRLHTTVGDLVVAIIDAALEIFKNEREAYQIAGLMVNKMLQLLYLRAIGRMLISVIKDAFTNSVIADS